MEQADSSDSPQLGAVQAKMSCIFETALIPLPTATRDRADRQRGKGGKGGKGRGGSKGQQPHQEQPDGAAATATASEPAAGAAASAAPPAAPAPAAKRAGQKFKSVATAQLRGSFAEYLRLAHASPPAAVVRATEKVDGTCTLVRRHPTSGAMTLWARLDRHLNKAGSERRAQQLAAEKAEHEGDGDAEGPTGSRMETAFFAAEDELKPLTAEVAAAGWFPADNTTRDADGRLQIDANGHLLGWVPLQPGLAPYKWHLTALNAAEQTGLFLIPDPASGRLRPQWRPLAEYADATVELVGPKIGKAYQFPDKSKQHYLVRHGDIELPVDTRALSMDYLKTWIPEQGIEGIVFHCRRAGDSKTVMFKVHCHHLDLSCWGSHDRAKTRLSRMTDFGEEEAES